MIIIPAIDIKDGKVVRLIQGQFNKVTEYDKDPLTVAKHWVKQGAQRLHVVDLDGAQTGKLTNGDLIGQITQSIDIPVEVGGGIRTMTDIDQLFKNGVRYVILGTRAIEDRTFLTEALQAHGDKIIVSIDCSNGKVAQRGWQDVSDIDATDLVQELEQLGLTCIVYTDIARDGMLTGPNFEGLETILKRVKMSVIASGGISNLEDIQRLKEYESQGLIGAITGKAIYENKLDLQKAIKLCNQI